MANIPVHEMAQAIGILRFTRVSVFHISKHTFPIQWYDSDQRDEAFRLYNAYSGMGWQPERGLEEGAHEKVFNWLLEQVTIDLVAAHDAHTGSIAQGFQTGVN